MNETQVWILQSEENWPRVIFRGFIATIPNETQVRILQNEKNWPSVIFRGFIAIILPNENQVRILQSEENWLRVIFQGAIIVPNKNQVRIHFTLNENQVQTIAMPNEIQVWEYIEIYHYTNYFVLFHYVIADR